MYIFIDTVSAPNSLILFEEGRKILDHMTWDGHHAEFDTLIEHIHSLLTKHHLAYAELSGIVCIVGPGSFTGIRVTTLVANTLAYSFKIPLHGISVGDFLALQNAPLPWILSITRREALVWETAEISTLRPIGELNATQYTSVTASPILGDTISITPAHDYAQVIKNLDLTHPVEQIQPIYAKEANVTIGKK